MNYPENSPPYDEDAPTRGADRGGGVEQRLDQLDDSLSALGEITETLASRLGPALRPSEPTPSDPSLVGAKLATVRQQSVLADRIESAAIRARSLTASLRDAYGRLDL